MIDPTVPTAPGSRWRSGVRTALVGIGLLLVPVVLAAVLGVTFLLVVFHIPPPPEAVSDASDAVQKRIRTIEGVLGATIDINPIDLKDGGSLSEAEAWRAEVVVRVEPELADLRSVARRIDSETSVLRQTVMTEGVIHVPDDLNGPEMTLRFSAPHASMDEPSQPAPIGRSGSAGAALEAATALRRIPSAISVSADARFGGESSIGIDAPEQLTDAVAAATILVRADGGPLASIVVGTSDPSGSDGGSVSIGTGSRPPSTELTAAVARLIDESGVWRADLDAARDTTGVEHEEAWRPHLEVHVVSIDDADATAAVIAGIAIAFDDGSPRPSFRVSAASAERVIEGYLGLPLGSEEPSDAIPGRSAVDAEIIPPDPEQDEAFVQESLILAESILLEAASHAGVVLESNAAVVACETRGRQVVGSALIPVADGAAGQQETFDAIVESWRTLGFSRTDRALGTDLYSGDGLQQLSIRGTAAGISITITSTCSV